MIIEISASCTKCNRGPHKVYLIVEGHPHHELCFYKCPVSGETVFGVELKSFTQRDTIPQDATEGKLQGDTLSPFNQQNVTRLP